MSSDLLRYWPLNPNVTYLNHGSFGACPWPVLRAQSELRARLEREPVQFMDFELEGLLDTSRAALAAFVGAQPDDLAFVPNASTGVNTVLRSLELQPGDEILTTDHEYNACLNAIRFVCERSGAKPVVASVPLPLASPAEVVEAILARATERTRLALVSHITSPTAIVFPVDRIVARLAERGIDTFVDGAHAPGMVPLDLDALGAAYYTGNAHKWLCAPKGSGFLHVRRDRQPALRPLVISHGANSPRTDRSFFRLEHDWTGTGDPTPYLSIPVALEFMAGLLAGGWPEIFARNRDLALDGRRRLEAHLQNPQPLAPDDMIGSMAAIEISAAATPVASSRAPDADDSRTRPPDPLRDALLTERSIEVPVYTWPHLPADDARPRRVVRISAQVYNSVDDYERLADALTTAGA